METINKIVEWCAFGIEMMAVAVIITGVLMVAINHGTVRYLFRLKQEGTYESYKAQLIRPLLLGLELMVAADVIRTVVLEPTLSNVAMLGLLVLVRTLLSWTLEVEMEGRWPWQGSSEKRR